MVAGEERKIKREHKKIPGEGRDDKRRMVTRNRSRGISKFLCKIGLPSKYWFQLANK